MDESTELPPPETENAISISNEYSIVNPSLYELSDSDDDSIQSLIFRLKQTILFSPAENKIHLQPERLPDEYIDNGRDSFERILVSNYRHHNVFEAEEKEMCNFTRRNTDRSLATPSPLSTSTYPSSSPSLPHLSFPPSESCSVAEKISQSDTTDLLLDPDNLLDKASSNDNYHSQQKYPYLHTLARWSPPPPPQQQQQQSSLYELSNSDSDDASTDAVIMRAKALTRQLQLRSGGHAILVGDEVIVSSLSNSSVSSESESESERISERVESCSSESSDEDSDD